jgi:hypothetical protein
MREVAIVGNGPLAEGAGAEIDRADHVVRFNRARGFGGAAGTRLDDLFLVNCGGQMWEWLHEPGFWTSPPLRAARRVSLPVEDLNPGSGLIAACGVPREGRPGINFELDARAALRRHGIPVRTMPDGVRRRAIRALSDPAPPRAIWPSTGFLAMFWYDATLPGESRITLHGFGFTGWPGHPWARERGWVRTREARGRITLRHATGPEARSA